MTGAASPRLRWAVLLISAALVGCGGTESPLDDSPESIAPAIRSTEAPVWETAGFTFERLGNATVTLTSIAGERATLRDGSYDRRSPPRVVALESGLLEIDDFDEDGQPEAAVVVSVFEGAPVPGQIPRPIRHLVLFGGSPPLQETEYQLPAGARVTAIRRVRGILELDLVLPAPGDRACCPSRRETRRYRYSGGTIRPI